jgi:hypothetical protein
MGSTPLQSCDLHVHYHAGETIKEPDSHYPHSLIQNHPVSFHLSNFSQLATSQSHKLHAEDSSKMIADVGVRLSRSSVVSPQTWPWSKLLLCFQADHFRSLHRSLLLRNIQIVAL